MSDDGDQFLKLVPATSSYDPRQLGARCDECVMLTKRVGGPVPSELNPGAKFAVVAQEPGEHEVDEGRPLVGGSGMELFRALNAVGIQRGDTGLINVCECRPPNNEMSKLLYSFDKENKKREKEGKPRLPSPADCCRPRFLAQIRRYRDVIVTGQTAMRAVVGGEQSIMKLRGGPIEGFLAPDGRFSQGNVAFDPDAKAMRVMPTIHPAFVLRARRWTKVFRSDVAKALRWFTGQLGWQNPVMEFCPSLERLREFLAQPREIVCFDYETDGIEPLVCRPRMLGLGDRKLVLVVGFLSIDGTTRFYSPSEEEAIKRELAAFMRSRDRLKGAWNAYYDKMVARRDLGVDPMPVLDGILFHRVHDSELPHGLGFAGSILTDVTAWKAGETATGARSDYELAVYNSIDVGVTDCVIEPLRIAAEIRGQTAVAIKDHKIQFLCAGMHENGMYVDQAARETWDVKLRADAIEYRKWCRAACGDEELNPGSYPAARELLFGKWDLPIQDLTEMGEPSTNDDVLRKLLVDKKTPEDARWFLTSLRFYRRVVKYRGTYIRKLARFDQEVPPDDLSEDEDQLARLAGIIGERWGEDAGEREELLERARERGKRKTKAEEAKRYGITLADGRMHPNWNAHGTTSGRLSSSDPNAQNFVRRLRNVIVPAPGNIFVYADMDQIELRLGAALAGAALYLEAFERGDDAHMKTTLLVGGKEAQFIYDRAAAKYGHGKKAKKDPSWDRLRDFMKRFTYATIYGAEIPTIHDTITSAEDDDWNLIYANVELRETRQKFEKWLAVVPEFEKWWEDEVLLCRKQGYLADCLWGRRRDFLDGEERSELLNFRCQSTAAAIVHDATIELCVGHDAPLRFQRWGPGTGLVNQGHDALLAEVPEAHGEAMRKLMQEAMTRRVPGLPVQFTAEAKLIRMWG